MTKKFNAQSVALAAGASFAISLAASPVALADANPFSMTKVSGTSTMQIAGMDGKCGEGKCGGSKAPMEGKCGGSKAPMEGKCGEGKCGANKAKAPMEGKCGGSKAPKEGKCGEGKCGGMK